MTIPVSPIMRLSMKKTMMGITSRLAVLAMFLALTINANAQRQDTITNGQNQTALTKAITVNLFYIGKNGGARKFVEEMESSGTADSIRHEPGNLSYDYFISLSDPETVLLIDSWESQKAIDAHHASPMMATLAKLRDKYDLHMKAVRYTKDENGLPAKDDKFIRH